MTQPRMVVAGDTVFCTVRTVARFYLLRPDKELNDAILYVLGVYSKKYKIKLLAVCVMSTHLHLVIEDPEARRPAFLRDVHRCIANVTKAMRGWRGGVFSAHPNQTRLLSTGAIIDKIAYTISNPVAAGAVQSSKLWPGLCASTLSHPEPFIVKRPVHYFREGGLMPEEATVTFSLPSALLAEHSEAEATEALKHAIQSHEDNAKQEVRNKGWTFTGPKRALSVSPYKRSTAYETFGSLNPHFAVKGGGKALYIQAVKALRCFRQSYREALHKWKQGLRDVCFPEGTYLMRVLHHVP